MGQSNEEPNCITNSKKYRRFKKPHRHFCIMFILMELLSWWASKALHVIYSCDETCIQVEIVYVDVDIFIYITHGCVSR